MLQRLNKVMQRACHGDNVRLGLYLLSYMIQQQNLWQPFMQAISFFGELICEVTWGLLNGLQFDVYLFNRQVSGTGQRTSCLV